MKRNLMWQLGVGALVLIAGAACQKCPPSDLTAGSSTCKWRVVQGSPRRNLVCEMGSIRVTVDTTGVGEG